MTIAQIAPAAVQNVAARAGFQLNDEASQQLAGYLDLLMQWNRVMNLVGTRTWEETFSTLVVDSLHLGNFLQNTLPHPPRISWDLGSGAGLPGLPLRMIWQEGTFWMVEAREKRAIFLSTVLARVPLPNTHVFRGRVEQFMAGPPPRQADLIMSRAFMPWEDVLTLVTNNLAPEGLVILLLGEVDPLQLEQQATAQNWVLRSSFVYTVGQTRRVLCALEKVQPLACSH